MSAKHKKPAPASLTVAPATPAVSPTENPVAAPSEADEFRRRHPKIANAIFAAVCIYVAMLWLLALDQTFHWGLFGPKLPPTP